MLKKFFVLWILVSIFLSSFGFRANAVSVSALSAVLYEPNSRRILYEKNAHARKPMASTTKIMTALLAVERCPPDKEITVSDVAVRVEGSALGLRGGDTITMQDLVTGLLLESGNDAANVIAYTLSGSIPEFAKLMNQRAAEIGMKETFFVTPSGLDQGDHSTTAYDMALLTAEALKNKTFAFICSMKNATISFGNPPRKISVSNHNALLKLYPYAVGVKTGFTKKSGRCLVSAAVKNQVQLIAVTLNAGDDWNDHIALYEYGYSQIESIQLPEPQLKPVAVTGGLSESVVPVMDTAPPACSVFKDEKDKIHVEISLPRFILAPLSKGDVIGSVVYKAGERELYTFPLFAAADVASKPVIGFWERAAKNFIELFVEWLKI